MKITISIIFFFLTVNFLIKSRLFSRISKQRLWESMDRLMYTIFLGFVGIFFERHWAHDLTAGK